MPQYSDKEFSYCKYSRIYLLLLNITLKLENLFDYENTSSISYALPGASTYP